MTNAMHCAYGVGSGIVYRVAAHALRPHPAVGAAGVGVGLWSLQYAELVPLGISKPPWEYPLEELGLDLSYHLVYGTGVAAAYAALR